MIALESEMQRLKKERTRAEDRLAQLVHEHGSTVRMSATDSRGESVGV
jgi:G:T-mismatch repair DNA endonuclease (very short patch repair protein)